MAIYKLQEGGVRKGNMQIPDDAGNSHWIEYQAWIDEGNTADPADPPRVPSNKENRKADPDYPELQDFMEAVMDGNPASLAQMKADFVNVRARNP